MRNKLLALFKEINNKKFENKLKIIKNDIFFGTTNFVVIVENEKKETFALRIAKDSSLPDVLASYRNTEKLYEKIGSILPKKIRINSEDMPYFILYEYFENNDVYKYLISIRDMDDKNEEFNNIIDQCIEHIKFVYENNIRCTDIKPSNFVLKFDKSSNKPIVKMIDIDDCCIFEDTIEDIYKKFLLLVTLYQFYLFFDNKFNLFEKQKKYIMTKIKENTNFFNSETKEQYKKIFDNIHKYYYHYYFLTEYYKYYNDDKFNFDFIWDKLDDKHISLLSNETLSSDSSPTTASDVPPPTKKKKTSADGKRLTNKKLHYKNVKKRSKKRSRSRRK